MNITFFGDSVTEGCFEIIRINGTLEILRDKPSCYASLLGDALRKKYPDKEFSFVNAGISGNNTEAALRRLSSDVLDTKPDLVTVCFGLNDTGDPEGYVKNLRRIFEMILRQGARVLFLTPNRMNRYVDPETPEELIPTAAYCAEAQNSGRFDRMLDAAKAAAREMGVYVADVNEDWNRLESYGVDTTALLCNHINHPSRKMHLLFRDRLLECMEENGLIQ